MVYFLQVDSVFAGHTALQAACQNGQVEAIRILLEFKADTEMQDKDGDRAIHHAIFCDKGTTIKPILTAAIPCFFYQVKNWKPFRLWTNLKKKYVTSKIMCSTFFGYKFFQIIKREGNSVSILHLLPWLSNFSEVSKLFLCDLLSKRVIWCIHNFLWIELDYSIFNHTGGDELFRVNIWYPLEKNFNKCIYPLKVL